VLDQAISSSLRSAIQHNVCWRDRAVRNRQDPQRAGQVKPLGAGRAGIEEQRVAEPLRLGLMGVAEDADVGPFSLQERAPILSEFPAFVQDVSKRNSTTAQFDHRLGLKAAPLEAIHIPGDGRDGGNLLQFDDHGPVSDIAGVQNVVNASKMAQDRPVKETVRVCDYADAQKLVV